MYQLRFLLRNQLQSPLSGEFQSRAGLRNTLGHGVSRLRLKKTARCAHAHLRDVLHERYNNKGASTIVSLIAQQERVARLNNPPPDQPRLLKDVLSSYKAPKQDFDFPIARCPLFAQNQAGTTQARAVSCVALYTLGAFTREL